MRKVEHEILQPQGFGSIQNNGLPIVMALVGFGKGLVGLGRVWNC